MKALYTLLLLALPIISFSQWPEFNRAHPVSCHWPAFNYTSQGYFENVFVVDNPGVFNDSYLVFGNGILCHPDSCINYTRCFSAKVNVNGELMWWRRYDSEEVDLNEQWFNWYLGINGGMIENHAGQYVSTFTTGTATDELNSENRDYLIKLDSEGEIQEQHLVDSTLALYSFHGLIEDYADSTYVTYGWVMDSLDVINNTEPDALLLKVDSLGNHLWQQTYNNTFGVWPGGVVKAMDGGFWLCCFRRTGLECSDNFTSNTDLVIIKTDSLGNEEDRIVMGGVCTNEIATVYEYEMDKVILAGRITTDEFGEHINDGDFYTALVEQGEDNQLLGPMDMKKYLYSENGFFTDIHISNDGTYVLTGQNVFYVTEELLFIRNAFILKLDSNRDSLWCRTYRYFEEEIDGESQQDAKYQLLDSKPTPDGGFVCSGWIEQWIDNPNPLFHTPWIFKVDSLGCLEPGCQDVGVSEIIIGLENTMSLFPNPVSSMANIAFGFPPDYSPPKNSELVVIDMQGREVMRQNLSMHGQSDSSIEMDVSKLSSGMYTVHWINGTAWLDSVKMVKE